MKKNDEEKEKKKKYNEKLSYKMPSLNERDYRMLMVINDFVCIRAWDIAIIAGFGSISYVNKRLLQFTRCGYIRSEYLQNEKIYTLTSKGKYAIGEDGSKASQIFNFNSQTTHYLYTARVAAIQFAKNPNMSYASIITDKRLKEYMAKQTADNGVKLEHRPDIVIGFSAYEIELNYKKYADLKANILNNSLAFQHQLWIVPKHLTTLREHIKKATKELGLNNVRVTTYERIAQEQDKFNVAEIAQTIMERDETQRWNIDMIQRSHRPRQDGKQRNVDKYRKLPATIEQRQPPTSNERMRLFLNEE